MSRWFVMSIVVSVFVAPVTAGDLVVDGRFVSTTTVGAPLDVSSDVVVDQLNADLIDGLHATDLATTADLASAGSAEVHYDNLVGVPGREIDQDCAVGAGCFGGDSGGFPVTITESGSYRLAGNLDTSGESVHTDAIVIQAPGVVLDLAGFSIVGPAVCTGDPVTSCDNTGSGAGIVIDSTAGATTVKNGTVRGMPRYGIEILAQARVVDMTMWENGGTGIDGDSSVHTVVTGTAAHRNLSHGITVSGTIVGNTAQGNGLNGIQGNAASTVSENSADGNGQSGIVATGGTTIRANSAANNSVSGLYCVDCLALDNISTGNSQYGIYFGGTGNGAFGRNLIYGNTTAALFGSAADMGGNICDGSPCP